MEYVNAVILGIIQGLAEFLPISSSGHLVIADALLREFGNLSTPKSGVTMEVALHFGTLLSILVVYRHDLWQLLNRRRLILMIVLATIPVGIAGIALKSALEQLFQEPIIAGFALLATAGLLLIGQKLQYPDPVELDKINLRQTLTIGLFQAIAIVPGISRSGSTIAAGMASGLSRESAARFSFLIAIPAIGGATVLQLTKLLTGEEQVSGSPLALTLGTLAAFIVGLLALRWMIRLVVADRLHYFALYCLLAGGCTIVWQLMAG